MAALLRTIGDRMLGAVLATEEAGACVPGHGDVCGCIGGYIYRYDCMDNCVVNTGTRC